ncbi:MAG TPA: hypothetical protein VF585_02395 [Chthoniobacterales bacterium]|jgi:hypothetical protein
MLQKKFSSPLLLALALGFTTLISGLQTAGAEENSGFSVGKVQFGEANDKWLTVDLKKTYVNSRTRTAVPSVNTNGGGAYNAQRTATRSSYPTSYATSYAAPTAVTALPPAYQPASTMVSNRKLLQAANIAVGSAHGRSTGSCWRYVKSALLKAEAIDSYPKTGYAKQAAAELVNDYGFVRTAISNPFSAPIGSVLVYGGAGAGHVEIRTRTGFVSDFVSLKPSKRPLLGVFVKR